MAHIVVDPFEAVEIDEQAGEFAFAQIRLVDLGIAVTAGAGMAALAFGVMTRTPPELLAQHFLERAYAEGGGTNVVNVILVDFRGFDTLGEITVLGAVALTVYGPEGPIVRNCTVRPRISDLKSSQDCLCLTVLRAWLAMAGFIACNHGMQMELPGLSAAVLPHWTQ